MTDQKHSIITVGGQRQERVEVILPDDEEDHIGITLEFSKNGIIIPVRRRLIIRENTLNNTNERLQWPDLKNCTPILEKLDNPQKVFGVKTNYPVLHELDNTVLINELYNLQGQIDDCKKKLKNLMDNKNSFEKNNKNEDPDNKLIEELKQEIKDIEIKKKEFETEISANLEFNLGRTDQERTHEFGSKYAWIIRQFKDDNMYLIMAEMLNKKVNENFFKFGKFVFNYKKYQVSNNFNLMYFYLHGQNYFVCTQDQKVYFVNLGLKISNSLGLPIITSTPEIYFINIINDTFEISAYKKPDGTPDWNKFPDNIIHVITFV